MGTRVKVIGTCPYCNRYVSRDLRPINMLTPRDAKRISQLINAEPPAPIQLDSETESEENSRLKVRLSKRKETTQEEPQANATKDAEAENSLEELTGNILNLVEQEFARSPECSGASRISEENAGVIVAMLTEEQRIIDKIERRALKRDVKEPPAKRRRC
ncbi:uncharacterized protein LOC128258016 [Drosophila gunungcola]|uniref:Uncharacterized protein n=1 Tax=Drosophila gunungcola TaxID=103775 RepID=A0A9P9YR63_9MUSC|nr:uncharacterized protein LOC128258016 [Drosophila gunungcola]KAI8041613.1 hypothetical protein M5D96_005878 [Drosophila gunungcola]